MGCLEQTRSADSRFQIGRGKARELAEMVKNLNAEKVIFDNELKPVQSYNLAKLSGVEVIDRFQLILEIFSRHASTSEARLQIRLAELKRRLPRAKEMVRLARMGERPGFLGLGRYEVDVYYEEIKRQIHRIRRELKRIRVQRGLYRDRRGELGFPLVSLAGYTNAGKTTLFNALTGESKLVDAGVFTTLTTTTRSIDLGFGRALLTDTVGFIERLPIALVEAFHSTLEETVLSDAIILLVDIHESLDEVERKLSYSLDTINEIGARGVPIITALNKVDLLSKEELEKRINQVVELAPNSTPISALEGINLDELKRRLAELLGESRTVLLSLPSTGESLSFISELHSRVNSLDTEYRSREILIKLTAFHWLIKWIEREVEKLNGEIQTLNVVGLHDDASISSFP